MDIRSFQEKDMDQLIKLWDVCDLLRPWNNPAKDIMRKMKVNPELFLVGEIDGEIVAAAMGGYEGHRGWVNYLAVSPKYRKQGLGKDIMLAVEDLLREKGCPKINLQVRFGNKDAILFYQSIGYKQDDVFSMGKRLEED